MPGLAFLRVTSIYRLDWTLGMSCANQPVCEVWKADANVSGRSGEQAVGGKSRHGVPFEEDGPLGAKNKIGSPEMSCSKTFRHHLRGHDEGRLNI